MGGLGPFELLHAGFSNFVSSPVEVASSLFECACHKLLIAHIVVPSQYLFSAHKALRKASRSADAPPPPPRRGRGDEEIREVEVYPMW